MVKSNKVIKRGLGLKKTKKGLTWGPEKRTPVKLLGHPTSFDWRTKGILTTVKDQKSCGSCVSFGTNAAIEAAYNIVNKLTNANFDLSEWDLFSRIGNCDDGAEIEDGCKAAQDGICSELCWPYNPSKPGKACADRANQLTKIVSYTHRNTDEEIKDWIANYGPMIWGLDVYDDFMSYTEGVYKQNSNILDGGHCICVVGYHDADASTPEGYWIIKNSWGPEFGEEGYFRIAYDQCNMGGADGYVAFGVTVAPDNPTPTPTPTPVPPVPPEPPVKPDITVLRDGKFAVYIDSIKSKVKGNLIFNGKDLGNLAKISRWWLRPTTLGDFKKGDGLTFSIKLPDGTIAHNISVSYSSFWKEWEVKMSASFNGLPRPDVVLGVTER
jgi:hypothetical protein